MIKRLGGRLAHLDNNNWNGEAKLLRAGGWRGGSDKFGSGDAKRRVFAGLTALGF